MSLPGRNGGEAGPGTVAFDHSAADILNRQNINISEIELLSFFPEGLPGKADVELSQGDARNGAEDRRNLRINVTDNSSLHLPHADVRVVCSKGTYVRALARDIGEALGSGAHLDALRRTRNGGFRVEDALSVDEAAGLFNTKTE